MTSHPRCGARNPATCRSTRCPNKVGTSADKWARLTPTEQQAFQKQQHLAEVVRRIDSQPPIAVTAAQLAAEYYG